MLPRDCGDAALLPRTKLDAAISGIFFILAICCIIVQRQNDFAFFEYVFDGSKGCCFDATHTVRFIGLDTLLI